MQHLIISLIWAAVGAGVPADQGPVVSDVYVLSDIDKGVIDIRVVPCEGARDRFRESAADLTVRYPDGSIRILRGRPFVPADAGAALSLVIAIDPVLPWHPETPNLYGLEMVCREPDGAELARVERRFGMRKLEARGSRLMVNNEPFYVRGCGHERDAFCDNLDRAGALKRLRQIKRYGFNTVRHHSHVPTEVYLDAADEVGVFIQMEISGRIGTDARSDAFQKAQRDWLDMVRRGRCHPCTFVYSMGNEIYKNDPGLVRCQNTLYDLAKTMDPAVLVLNRSGSNPLNDDHGRYDLIERPIGEYEHVAEFAREAFELYLHGDRKGCSDTCPIIAHEYPLVASYPNADLAAKYDEPPWWIELTVTNARAHGLEHLLPDFVRSSERIQALCRKEMLEEARRFRELDGYSMLRFTDCGALVSGVADDFSDPKSVTAEEFLHTNGQTVLLCTWNKRSFTVGEQLQATLEISHHGRQPFSAPNCRWWLLEGFTVMAEGAFDAVRVDPVDVAEVGRLVVEIPRLHRPAKLVLRAVVPDAQPPISNEWTFWAFPRDVITPSEQQNVIIWDPRQRLQTYRSVYPHMQVETDEPWSPPAGANGLIITDSWQPAFYDLLDRGGTIWVISDKTWPWPEEIGIFGLHITKFIPSRQAQPVFPELDEHCTKWLTVCSNSKSRYGNSGTLVSPHAALGDFPHEGFCDLHFWPMIYRAKSLQLDRFPPGTQTPIRAIDNFHRGCSKGYMAEIGVGRGWVFVSTLNFTQSFARDVATRYLFDQVLRYLTGPDREMVVHISVDELRAMIDSFAAELAERAPLLRDEMPARYSTRWKALLSPNEMIELPVYEAQGVDPDRLSVQWEYAETRWIFDARASDRIVWTFRNRTAGDFACTLHLAGGAGKVPLAVEVDRRGAMPLVFPGSADGQRFVPLSFRIAGLDAGEHRLTLSFRAETPVEGDRVLRIRETMLQAENPSD